MWRNSLVEPRFQDDRAGWDPCAVSVGTAGGALGRGGQEDSRGSFFSPLSARCVYRADGTCPRNIHTTRIGIAQSRPSTSRQVRLRGRTDQPTATPDNNTTRVLHARRSGTSDPSPRWTDGHGTVRDARRGRPSGRDRVRQGRVGNTFLGPHRKVKYLSYCPFCSPCPVCAADGFRPRGFGVFSRHWRPPRVRTRVRIGASSGT